MMLSSDRFVISGKAFADAAALVGETLAGCAGRVGSSMKRYSSVGVALAASKIQPVPPSELDLPPALILPAAGAYCRRSLARQLSLRKSEFYDQPMEVSIKKYRPINETEGEFLISHYCENCQKDDIKKGCNIQLRAMAFEVNKKGYPVQWQYDADGNPICTAFSQA
jgi:hypothetical protein